MDRRQYLGGLAVVGSAGVAGCGGLASALGLKEGPKKTAKAFFEAINDGDLEAANDLLHERVGRVQDHMSESELDRIERHDLELENADTAERDDDEAKVEIIYEYDGREFNLDVGLNREDEEWRVIRWQG